nr:GAF domain-containing protein [Cytophagales bacterium]
MDRLEDLRSYRILDTEPEAELNDLAEVASAIFGTPVSIISFMDDKRQWFKANIGLDFSETKIEDTFCKYTLDKPNEVLVIENPAEDERVKNNPFVTSNDAINFYASAPLVSKAGNVLGTVCVFDYEKKQFSSKQYEALKLIAKKVMNHLETRKMLHLQNQEIEHTAFRLKKITDLVPGAIFKMSLKENGAFRFVFISDGVQRLIPDLCPVTLKAHPTTIFRHICKEDLRTVFDSFNASYKSVNVLEAEFRVRMPVEKDRWLWIRANPEKRRDNEVVWFGIVQDISDKMNHLKVLEKMIFDISHVIRRPIANILTAANFIDTHEVPEKDKKEMYPIIIEETRNLDQSINYLNDEYYSLRNELNLIWRSK